MKKQLKRFSKSTLAIVLTLCMLISCMTVGMIATDAAKVQSESVGDYDLVKLTASFNGWSTTDEVTYPKGDVANFTHYLTKGTYYFKIIDNQTYYSLNDFNKTDSASWVQLYTNNNNDCTFKVTSDGAYTFQWSQKDQKINIFKEPDFKLKYGTTNGNSGSELTLNQSSNKFTNTMKLSSATYMYVESNAGSGATNLWSVPKANNDYDANNFTKWNCQLSATASSYFTVEKADHGDVNGRIQALVTPKNNIAKTLDCTFSFDADTKQLYIDCAEPTSYVISASDQTDCSITATWNDQTITNGGSMSVYEGETVNVSITPTNMSDKISAISVSGNTPAAMEHNEDVYTTSFVVSAAGQISATVVQKQNVTVTLDTPSNGSISASVGGVAQTSPFTVLEGTKVTFTATPDDGYVFSGWSGITASTSTAAVSITAATTVTATFAKQGYKVVMQGAFGDSGLAMTELDNGKFITSTKINDGFWFRIVDTGRNKISKGTANGQLLSINKETKVDDWETTPATWNPNRSFENGTGEAAFVVYDPAKDKVYLTTEKDGLFSEYVIYIKDGTVRALSTNNWTGHSADYGTTELLADGTTQGVSAAEVDNYGSHVKKITVPAATVRSGVNLHIKTTVGNNYKTKYYVKGFDVNGGLTRGIVSQEFDESDAAKAQAAYSDARSGERICATNPYNDFTLTLEAEKFPDGIMEVTPIYFPLVANYNKIVRFYAYDFTEDVKDDWGGMLAVYPYIRDTYDPYGGYPGQLMVKEGGVYYSDIPVDYTYTPTGGSETTVPIQGLTMNNYVWDALHYDLFYGSDQAGNNWQTYDYNEFAIINKLLQKNGKAGEDIIFSFKYKTKADSTKANSNLGESTYYENSPSEEQNGDKDYRTSYNTLNPNNAQYQWEDLTDFYGHRVDIFGDLVDTIDNEEKPGYNPIRIVSNGYDDNKVGYFATAWALYKPVKADGKEAWTGQVDHYVLFDVMGGQGRTQRDYPGESYLIDPEYTNRIKLKYGIEDAATVAARKAALKQQMIANGEKDTDNNPITDATPDEKIKWPKHVLDCEKVPVMITYEYNIQSNDSNAGTAEKKDMAYRSDGRWYYSSSEQILKANIIVEVANSKSSPFERDYFQANNYDYTSGDNYVPSEHTGLNSQVKAYFTSSNAVDKDDSHYQNVVGNTQMYSISDGEEEHDYRLKAEEDSDGNYEFVAWYRLTENASGVGYTLASEDREFSTEAKTNEVYVARFVKIPSGKVTITHNLKEGSIGTADCEAKVEILNSDGTLDTVIKDYTTDSISVTSKYIKYNTGKKIRITLKTTPTPAGRYLFDKFWEKSDGTNVQELVTSTSGTLLNPVTVNEDRTAVIIVDIDKLFGHADPTDENSDMVLKTEKLPFYSSLKMPELSYNLHYKYKSNIGSEVYYGQQGYLQTGTFTQDEIAQYVVWDDSLETKDGKNGWYKFNPDTMASFLANKCPYEKNIREDLVWNYSDASKIAIEYFYNNTQFSVTMNATQTPITTKRVQFKFPCYAVNKNGGTAFIKDEAGYVIELGESAPPQITVVENSQDVIYHKYISLHTDYAVPYMLNREEGSEYFPENPIYVTAPDKIYSADHSTVKYFQYWSVQTIPADVDASGNVVSENDKYRQYEIARCYNIGFNFSLYQDYIVEAIYGNAISTREHENSASITFVENGRNQWNNGEKGKGTRDSDDRIFSDFMIAFDRKDKKELRTCQSGDENIKVGVLIDRIETIPEANGSDSWATKSEKEYYNKYGEDVTDAKTYLENAFDPAKVPAGHQYTYQDVDVTKLDNKNRAEYIKVFANVKNNGEASNRRNYVYRAYAYMIEADGTTVTISKPVYFTIYDIATIADATRQSSGVN